jgi:predicted molibdopterin-dependent oxidoreductase YjgC
MGVLPDRLPGHAALDDRMASDLLGKLWGCSLPVKPGKSLQADCSTPRAARSRRSS